MRRIEQHIIRKPADEQSSVTALWLQFPYIGSKHQWF